MAQPRRKRFKEPAFPVDDWTVKTKVKVTDHAGVGTCRHAENVEPHKDGIVSWVWPVAIVFGTSDESAAMCFFCVTEIGSQQIYLGDI